MKQSQEGNESQRRQDKQIPSLPSSHPLLSCGRRETRTSSAAESSLMSPPIHGPSVTPEDWDDCVCEGLSYSVGVAARISGPRAGGTVGRGGLREEAEEKRTISKTSGLACLRLTVGLLCVSLSLAHQHLFWDTHFP